MHHGVFKDFLFRHAGFRSDRLHRFLHCRFVEGRHGGDFAVTLFRIPDAESEHDECVRRFDDINEIIDALGIVDGLAGHPQFIRLGLAGLKSFLMAPIHSGARCPRIFTS